MGQDGGRLARKVVLVIGGARGIGRGIAERCAAEGASVVIADLSPERDNVAAAIGARGAPALALPLDARRAEDHEDVVTAAVARFGRIDALVYSAGIFPRGTLLETDEALWHAVLATNLTGAFLACRAVVPRMAAQGGGAIVTIGSLHARRGSASLLAYAVSKGGLVTLTRNLAAALARDRIRVNCVHPGWVLSEGEIAVRGIHEAQARQFALEAGSRIPLGRMQAPDDIAHAVVYLVSDEAAQVTGQEIAVDGGLSERF
jgi:NAD(P)-dependent dehydrogenase (short-subunit alcohol dehydrogenase family)